MDIQFMRLDGTGDTRETETIIMADKDTVIRIVGFGTGEYSWTVANANKACNAEYDPMVTIAGILGKDGWFNAAESFGQLAVWWDKRTFAHAVMDVLRNQ